MTHDRSIAELRAESERTRAALANSVTELRSQLGATANDVKTLVSPTHIKEEVKTYVRETGTNFIDNMSARARENPLQAIAAGAAIAYPLMKMFRAVPLPLMLIGAGFWLSSQKGRETLRLAGDKVGETFESAASQTADVVASTIATASDLKDGAINSVNNAASSVTAKVQPAVDSGRAAMQDMRDSMTGVFRNAKDAVSSAAHDASAAMNEATNSGSSVAQSAAERVKANVSHFTASAGETATSVAQATARSQQTVADFAQQNALLTAAVGLAAGAFLAAAFPSTRTEQKAFGDKSARLQRAGRDAVGRGIDKATEVADDAMRSVASAAEREGLTAEAVAGTIKDVTNKAKAVADRGMQAASAPVQANGEYK